MFFPVQVQPEVGEAAAGFPAPYLEGREIKSAYVQGILTKVDIHKKQLKIQDFKPWIPFHRIVVFTFGGIEIVNEDYDEEARWTEDQAIINRLRRGK